MRTIFIFIAVLGSLTISGFSQDFKGEFDTAFTQNDTASQRVILQQWEVQQPNNPELFIAYFNYHINKSTIVIDEEDSTNTSPSVGIFRESYYNSKELRKAYKYINEGIKKNPNRLDMRMGLMYMLGETDNYPILCSEIIKALDYADTIQNKWLWYYNEPLDSAAYFLLNVIENYQGQLSNERNASLYPYIETIAVNVLKYYPNNITSLSNLAICYTSSEKYDKALEMLQRIKKQDDKDYMLLSNIAYTYKLKGDKKNAIKYYKLAKKYGNSAVKRYADEQILELSEK